MKLNIYHIKNDLYGVNEDIDNENETGFDTVYFGTKENCLEVIGLIKTAYDKGYKKAMLNHPV